MMKVTVASLDMTRINIVSFRSRMTYSQLSMYFETFYQLPKQK